MEYSGNLWIGRRFGETVAEIRSVIGRDTLVRRFVLRPSVKEQSGETGPLPPELRGATLLEVPLQKVVALSSAQIGYMLRLGVADRIVAVGEGRYIADSALYARVASGDVAEVENGGSLDLEKVIALQPDLVMTFATGGAHDDYERINALGLPLMLTSEWQEESPLTKAEWIKLYGVLFDKKALADSIYEQCKREYLSSVVKVGEPAEPRLSSDSGGVAPEQVRGRLWVAPAGGGSEQRRLRRASEGETSPGIDKVTEKSSSEKNLPSGNCPRVLVGMSYGGVWYAPGGNSFTARLIKDAGGCYLWAADTSRELKFTLEEIMLVADSADVWVNPGMFSTPQELLASEPRVKYIRAFREKRVCQNDGVKGPGGGNDFYESAVAYPAELLKNLRNCLLNATNGADSARSEFDWYRNIFIF